MVAGMLRETISRSVALISAAANRANDEPTTVKAAARPNARYSRDRIVRSQVNEPNRPRMRSKLNVYLPTGTAPTS